MHLLFNIFLCNMFLTSETNDEKVKKCKQNNFGFLSVVDFQTVEKLEIYNFDNINNIKSSGNDTQNPYKRDQEEIKQGECSAKSVLPKEIINSSETSGDISSIKELKVFKDDRNKECLGVSDYSEVQNKSRFSLISDGKESSSNYVKLNDFKSHSNVKRKINFDDLDDIKNIDNSQVLTSLARSNNLKITNVFGSYNELRNFTDLEIVNDSFTSDTSDDLEYSYILQILKDRENSNDLNISNNYEASNDLNYSNNLEIPNDLNISNNLEVANDSKFSKYLGISNMLQNQNYLECSNELTINYDSERYNYKVPSNNFKKYKDLNILDKLDRSNDLNKSKKMKSYNYKKYNYLKRFKYGTTSNYLRSDEYSKKFKKKNQSKISVRKKYGMNKQNSKYLKIRTLKKLKHFHNPLNFKKIVISQDNQLNKNNIQPLEYKEDSQYSFTRDYKTIRNFRNLDSFIDQSLKHKEDSQYSFTKDTQNIRKFTSLDSFIDQYLYEILSGTEYNNKINFFIADFDETQKIPFITLEKEFLNDEIFKDFEKFYRCKKEKILDNIIIMDQVKEVKRIESDQTIPFFLLFSEFCVKHFEDKFYIVMKEIYKKNRKLRYSPDLEYFMSDDSKFEIDEFFKEKQSLFTDFCSRINPILNRRYVVKYIVGLLNLLQFINTEELKDLDSLLIKYKITIKATEERDTRNDIIGLLSYIKNFYKLITEKMQQELNDLETKDSNKKSEIKRLIYDRLAYQIEERKNKRSYEIINSDKIYKHERDLNERSIRFFLPSVDTNSCYFNAFLTFFFSDDKKKSYFVKTDFNETQKLCCLIKEFINSHKRNEICYYETTMRYLPADKLKNDILELEEFKEHFEYRRQEDVDEFHVIFFNTLAKESKCNKQVYNNFGILNHDEQIFIWPKDDQIKIKVIVPYPGPKLIDLAKFSSYECDLGDNNNNICKDLDFYTIYLCRDYEKTIEDVKNKYGENHKFAEEVKLFGKDFRLSSLIMYKDLSMENIKLGHYINVIVKENEYYRCDEQIHKYENKDLENEVGIIILASYVKFEKILK